MISAIYGKRRLLLIALLVFAFSACVKSSTVDKINTTSDGIAIKGYDPVAYFVERKPLKGNEEFGYTWMGAKWLFSSAENRDIFKSNPEKYSPQFGGY